MGSLDLYLEGHNMKFLRLIVAITLLVVGVPAPHYTDWSGRGFKLTLDKCVRYARSGKTDYCCHGNDMVKEDVGFVQVAKIACSRKFLSNRFAVRFFWKNLQMKVILERCAASRHFAKDFCHKNCCSWLS